MKKRIKSALALLMCLLIFLSVPSTVYAKSYEVSSVRYSIRPTVSTGQSFSGTFTIPQWFANNSVKQSQYHYFQLTQQNTFNFDDGDTVILSISLGDSGNRYKGFTFVTLTMLSGQGDLPRVVTQKSFEYGADSVYWLDSDKSDSFGSDVFLDFDYSTETYTYSITLDEGYDDCYFIVSLDAPSYSSGFNASTSTLAFGVTAFNVEIGSYTTSMFAQISDFFANLAERLTGWFDSLFGWLKDIRDNALDGFKDIGNWFSELGDKIQTFFNNLSDNIKGFFTELGNKISGFFTDLKNNLKTWFDNIGNWFTEIGDKISGFFEKLWNRIWYGNENGASEYQKPVINNKLNDILDTMDGYQQQLKDTISTINTSAEQVSTYISTGTQLIEGVIGVGGVGLTALIVFGMVFILVRKVVGR